MLDFGKLRINVCSIIRNDRLGEVFWPGPLLGRPEIMGHKLQHFMPVSLCVRLSCYWLSFNNAFTEKLVLNADLWVCIFWQRLNESNTSRTEMTFKFYSLLYVARPMRTHVLFFLLLLACSSSRILLQQGIWKFKVELDLLLCILLLWSLFFLATTLNSDKFLLFSYSNESTLNREVCIAVTLEYIYLASHLDFFIIWAVIFVASWIISRVCATAAELFLVIIWVILLNCFLVLPGQSPLMYYY